ncbi:CD8A protein, partial [Erithacus rubecula]|nr:CD8A protein [Erithacus rubecula]
MDTSPALLLLLTLGFCEYRHGISLQIKVTSPRDISQLQVGQRLQLKCHTDKDSGTSWIRRDNRGTLHFIVFISSTSRTTFRNQETATRFEASKSSKIYYLAVKSFTPQDEGSYFCVMNFNQMLYFSPGQPAFLPATTVALTTCQPTTKGGTTEHPNLKTPDPGSRMQENLEHFCLVFLWVPLAGLCLLLLQLLATILVRLTTTPSRCSSGL